MGARRMGSTQRRNQRAKVHSRNNKRKTRERASRERRLLAAIRGGSLPFDPVVMSWLSTTLGKSPRLVTQADVDSLAGQAAVA